MDPHHQRGFLVSGQRPPEMNLVPPDKDFNLGQLGTPALMNQFYPGSRETDPINDVNNLPVPDRNYRHQPATVHDKLVINTDVMLPRAVTGSRSDDELINMSQEQNGTVSSSLSPGLLDTKYAFDFDPGPDQDGRPHFIQFSDFNGSNSNFGSPASDEHTIEDDQAMETQGEASHDGHGNDLAADQVRQMGHNADSLPIAPVQNAHGAGQFDGHADSYDGSQQMIPSENTFRVATDVAGHQGQLHMDQTLETSGITYNSAQHVPNSDAPCGLGAQDHYEFWQSQIDGQGNHQVGHGSMGSLSYGHGDYYSPMNEIHQQAERQQHNENGNRIVQVEAMEHTFRAGPDVTRHESQLHVEQTFETSGQTCNLADSRGAPSVFWAPDQQMECLPENLANVLPARNARRDLGAQDNSEFCHPQMELHQKAESQQHHRNGAPAVLQSYNGDRMVYAGAAGQSFRAAQGGTRHADLLYLEQPLEQSAQAYGSAQHLSNSDAAHFHSVQHRPEPAGTTVGEFCQRRLEMQWEAERQQAIERQHGAMRNEAPQSIGNHFYREKSWDQPTIGGHQADHDGSIRNGAPQVEQQAVFNETMRPLSYGQGDYHPVMGEGTQRRFTPHGHATQLTRQEVLQGMNLRYQGVESGSYQANSGDVEATDNITGGPRNCRLDFQGINITTRSASLSDHTDDQISSSEESGFYSSPSTPDQTTTDGSTNGLLPPIVTSEEPPLNQLFLPNFTVQSKDDEAFQQAQWEIFMDYSDKELDRMDNNGYLLIDNNDTIGFDVDRLCETYEYYASGMNNMLPLDILSNNEVEHFSLTGFLMSGNNEGSTSSSASLTPEKKRRNRRSGIKMTPEQKKAHKKEANRKYSTISRDKKKSERDITNRIWKYVQNEIQIQQAAITDVENNVAFANELLELTGQVSDLDGVLQQESQFYMYWKGEISRVLDIRRNEDTKVQDALLRKQSAKEKFEKSGEEYKSKHGGKKTTTIGSQKTRALQNHELVKAQYHILVNRHDLRREKFLKGLADLYFRRTVSMYIQRIWTIPVEVHQLLSQEQKLHQLDKLRNFLRSNRHLLRAPS